MQIKSYKNASEIPEKYLPSLVDREIECWGAKPFDEFKICTNSNCKALYSIEDVYGSIENYKSRKEDKEFKCNCGCETEYVYEKEGFLELLKEYVKGEVSAVLLIDESKEEVEGFATISKSTFGKIIDLEFATRPGSYKDNYFLESISNNFNFFSNIINKEVVLLHHIYVAKDFRSNNTAFKMSKKIFFDNKSYKGLPVILETRYDSDFYSISRGMGFKDILCDKYGYVIQCLEDYELILDFFELNNSYVSRNKIKEVSNYKKESLKILKENPSFSEQKIYINN